jgi:hypothetical protein
MVSKTRKCPSRKIRRSAYTRKSYTRKDGIRVKGSRVKSACIKDMGKPGKGKRLFTLKKGELTQHGYSLKSKADRRRKALKRSMKKIGKKGTLVKKLNALYVLHKNTNPVYAKKARSDMKWVQSNVKDAI